MEGTPRENRVYYRCAARSIVPGAPALATHLKNVYLPESAVVGPISEWIGSLFGPEHCGGTVRRLLSADANSHVSARGAAAAKAVADAERRLRRLQSAIEAGVDPAALVEPINGHRRSWKPGRKNSGTRRLYKRSVAQMSKR
jgi:hypothetical protein